MTAAPQKQLSRPIRQCLYAGFLILGASILTFRCLAMIYDGALRVLVAWVASTIFLELSFDVACLLYSMDVYC
jgi:hypothetical protein